MSDAERRGREWCEANCEEPEWYEPLQKWYWQLTSIQGDINRRWFETDAEAYAAVGDVLIEMERVLGMGAANASTQTKY